MDYYVLVPRTLPSSDENLMIYKVTHKILYNSIHFNNSINMSDITLEKYNFFAYKLKSIQKVIPILTIKFIDLQIYLEQFNSLYSLRNLNNNLVLNSYFKYQNKEYLDMIINNIYLNISFSKYTNITDFFSKRKFKHYLILKDDDYTYTQETKEFIDISYSINKFDISEESEFNNNDIYNLLLNLDENHQVLLFSYLIISNNNYYCITDNKILKMMIKHIYNFGLLFRYLLSYTWIRLYTDECHKIKSYKYMFDLDTASLLPVYPYNYLEPKNNPYLPLLISDTLLLPHDNLQGLAYDNKHDYGICNQEEFNLRFNIFTTNSETSNLFENYDFKENNAYIVGSSITACSQKNPLTLLLFKENDIKKYFDEYYSDADIDIMILDPDINNYLKIVDKLINHLNINVCKINNISKHIFTINTIKTFYFIISEDFIKQNITQNPEEINNILKGLHTDNVIELFKPYINKIYNKKYRNSKILSMNSNIELYKIMKKDEVTDDLQELFVTIKYQISSTYLLRDIEIFTVYNKTDPNEIVSQFHLPCVRAYYDGIKTMVFPSFISALITRMQLDYKYMNSKKSPIDIILKYLIRGFGIYLNTTEIITIRNNLTKKTCLYHIKPYEIFKPIDLKSRLVKPKIYNIYNLNPVIIDDRYSNNKFFNCRLLGNINDAIRFKFNINSNSNLNNYPYSQLICINECGYINSINQKIINKIINDYYNSSNDNWYEPNKENLSSEW